MKKFRKILEKILMATAFLALAYSFSSYLPRETPEFKAFISQFFNIGLVLFLVGALDFSSDSEGETS